MLEILFIIVALFCIARNKIELPILIILGFVYSDWICGESMSDFLFLHNYLDTGLLLTFALILKIKSRTKSTIGIHSKLLKKGVLVFLVFFIIAAVFDLLVNGVYLSSIIKVFRLWAFLTLLWFIPYLRQDEVDKIFKYIYVFTVFLSAVFIVEYMLDISITGAVRTREGTRASLPWPPAMLVFTLILCGYYKIKTKYMLFSIGIILFNLIICGSRSFFLSYILCFLLFVFIDKMDFKKIALLSIMAIGLIVVLSTDNILMERFEESKSDISSIKAGSNDVEGNLSFRILMLQERAYYIAHSPLRFIFGLGCVQERDFPKNVFLLGLIGEDGNVIQLDTGDISWTLLLIRFGFVGTFLYLLFFVFRFIRISWSYRQRNVAKSIFIYIIVNLLFMSWTYPFLASSCFWVLPIISLRLIEQEQFHKAVIELKK